MIEKRFGKGNSEINIKQSSSNEIEEKKMDSRGNITNPMIHTIAYKWYIRFLYVKTIFSCLYHDPKL